MHFNSFYILDHEYRIIINNTEGIGEICSNGCKMNDYKIKIIGNRILSFPIKKRNEYYKF